MNDTPTPRTDALLKYMADCDYSASAQLVSLTSLARELERALTTAKLAAEFAANEVQRLQCALGIIDDITASDYRTMSEASRTAAFDQVRERLIIALNNNP